MKDQDNVLEREIEEEFDDHLGLQDVDYVEHYVSNAKQTAHYYITTFGFQLKAYSGLETGVRDRSSYYLEDVATEYEVQGLELDWVCACWDAGLRRVDDEWELYKFVGTKFQKRSQEHQRKYLLNAYRVLLTRARQGLIIFVPRGDIRDKTRDPKFYDGTYEYLINCGFDEL